MLGHRLFLFRMVFIYNLGCFDRLAGCPVIFLAIPVFPGRPELKSQRAGGRKLLGEPETEIVAQRLLDPGQSDRSPGQGPVVVFADHRHDPGLALRFQP